MSDTNELNEQQQKEFDANQAVAEAWCVLHPIWRQCYGSPEQDLKLVERARRYASPVATISSLDRSFSELKKEGSITALREQPLPAVPEPDRKFYDFIGGLSQPELSKLFFSDRKFEARFRRAVQLHNFRLPRGAKPNATGPSVTELTADGHLPISLTIEQYNEMSISEVKRRYASEPEFAAAVDQLDTRCGGR